METKLPAEPAIQQFRGPAHEAINKKPTSHLVIEIHIRDGDGSIGLFYFTLGSISKINGFKFYFWLNARTGSE